MASRPAAVTAGLKVSKGLGFYCVMLSEKGNCCVEESILNSSGQKDSYNMDNTLTRQIKADCLPKSLWS